MSTPKIPKQPPVFECKTCDLITSSKKDYSKHLLTSKHIKSMKIHENQAKTMIEIPEIPNKCSCGKQYKDRSGLWRHQKKCTTLTKAEATEKAGIALKITELENAMPNMDMNLIFAFMKDTQEFKQMVLEQSKIITDLVGKVGNTTNNINNTQNNQFNLQFFLNDTCKGAMNVRIF